MEEILLKLLVADNAIIQQGTAELREAFKHVESTPALCQLIISSNVVQVRQYAAVLLRKRYSNHLLWTKLPQNIRTDFKAVILQGLVNEPEKPVKNAIAQLIGVIVKHELPNNEWPEVLQFVQHLITNENLANKELGMYTLSIMTEIAPDAYLPHVQSLMEMLMQTMNSLQDLSHPVASYILDTMLHLVTLVEGNQVMVNAYHAMMPQVMKTIQVLTEADPYKAIKAFELLDELCESAIMVVIPHIQNLVSMCLVIASNKSYDTELRIKAVTFIGWIARLKKKAFLKHKLVEPIVDMLFSIMSTKPDEECEEVYVNGDNEDNNTPITSATQTLDLMALHLPPEKLIPYLLKHIEVGLQGTNEYSKKASYLAMAVLAEGCSEYIRTKHLDSFLCCICRGITDTSVVVRNAALFALGQFSEHLQPDISRYASQLLPVLFEFLSQMCAQIRQEKKEVPSIDRMFYALEMFCENLHEDLLPYLPTLMNILFEILSCDSPVHVRELALSGIGAAANASKEHIVPYFERIISILNHYLMEEQSDETLCLQIQSVETLGVIARTIGEDNFRPLAAKSMEIGIQLLTNSHDPDLKKSVYGLLASISIVVKQDMHSALPGIFEYMIDSIQSSEGIVTRFKDDESSAYLVYEDSNENDSAEEEDIENTDNEDDDDDDIAGYSVENAYIEEKEEAILALKEIAEHTNEAFLPYLQKSFEEIFKVISYPQEDIRKAATEALLQFCINFSKIQTDEGKEAAQKALSLYIPKLSEMIRLDVEMDVVINALEAISELLKHIKSNVFVNPCHREAVMNCIYDVMTGKTQCQDQEDEGDDGEAEQDELLFECAGDVLANFGKASSPSDFEVYFRTILPILLGRMKKKSDSQRSFGIGTILECFSGLGNKVSSFVPQLLPIFIKMTNDSCDEVRNNAIFGLGELALHGREAVYTHYNDILQALSSAISKESNAGVRDNVIGAIARLIITNYTLVPLEQVFPVFIAQLPLKEDFAENKTVYNSVLTLYRNGHVVIRPHISRLLTLAIGALRDEKAADEETKSIVIEFVRSAKRDFPEDWNTVFAQLPADVAAECTRIFM